VYVECFSFFNEILTYQKKKRKKRRENKCDWAQVGNKKSKEDERKRIGDS
jgi:hypothetical protein